MSGRQGGRENEDGREGGREGGAYRCLGRIFTHGHGL